MSFPEYGKDGPTEELSILFQPIKIGKMGLKNRIVMAPMCSRLPTPEGEVTQAVIDHYRERAGRSEYARHRVCPDR